MTERTGHTQRLEQPDGGQQRTPVPVLCKHHSQQDCTPCRNPVNSRKEHLYRRAATACPRDTVTDQVH
jgi:hypothetical protein